MKNIYFLSILLLLVTGSFSQNTISGIVYGQISGDSDAKEALISANIYWAETTIGSVTDTNGRFEIIISERKNNRLVISYIGYQNDTVEVSDFDAELSVVLIPNDNLDEVIVRENQQGEYMSKIKTIQTQTITEEGLQRMPCCNLAESFENSATVDAGFTDAVSGARQIKMLGLAGKYSQIMLEKRPLIRGLSNSFGLMHIPGSWMESIQISKGTSSVVDGYESISGQINIEYKKPDKSNPLHVNLYSNNEGRFEGNILSAYQVNEVWSTMLLLSGGYMGTMHDNNNDGFLDAPLTDQIHVLNRWKYNKCKIKFQVGIDILDEKRNGGQTSFLDNEESELTGNYGIGIDNRRYEIFAKGGITLPGDSYRSIALISSASYHELNSFFGIRKYNAEQKSLYVNAIYHTELGNELHKITSGISIAHDEFVEMLDLIDLGRNETVTGIYSEYSFNNECDLNIIAGIRYDYSSLYGGFLIPRVHVKYKLSSETTIRGSAGRGHRVANIIAENTGYLASSREFIIAEKLQPEDAWNTGVSLSHEFSLRKDRELSFSIDYYRIQFVNQVMVDIVQDKHSVYFYNLDGTSYSNSMQLELSTELFDGFDVTGAFRMNDVKVTLNNSLQNKPFVNKYKGLLTMSYETSSEKWEFDLTTQYNGKTRLPDISQNMDLPDVDLYSEDYYIIHAQITRKFNNLSMYLGSENLTGFVQKDPIIDPANPFGEDFDASRIWGPILGRMFFLGLRFDIE